MGQESLNSSQIEVKDKKKTTDNPEQIKINPVDITFYILLAIVIICLIGLLVTSIFGIFFSSDSSNQIKMSDCIVAIIRVVPRCQNRP